MARKKTFTVNSPSGLNLRERPTKAAKVVKVLKDGEKVKVTEDEAPEGWVSVEGGYVMAAYLR